LAGLVGLSAELQQPVDETATGEGEAPIPSQTVAEGQSETLQAEKPPAIESEAVAAPQPEADTVKNTAAAWASWRQIRDISKDTQTPPPPSREFEGSQPLEPETSARAVAAGAVTTSSEQSLPETVAIAPNGDSQDVASIVDSVLADLRPKLMAEISRKMAEKK
jgi:hypothetical protein